MYVLQLLLLRILVGSRGKKRIPGSRIRFFSLGDTAQLQAFNNNNESSMTYVIEIDGLISDKNEVGTPFSILIIAQ
jgi:hypothetical protein